MRRNDNFESAIRSENRSWEAAHPRYLPNRAYIVNAGEAKPRMETSSYLHPVQVLIQAYEILPRCLK